MSKVRRASFSGLPYQLRGGILRTPIELFSTHKLKNVWHHLWHSRRPHPLRVRGFLLCHRHCVDGRDPLGHFPAGERQQERRQLLPAERSVHHAAVHRGDDDSGSSPGDER